MCVGFIWPSGLFDAVDRYGQSVLIHRTCCHSVSTKMVVGHSDVVLYCTCAPPEDMGCLHTPIFVVLMRHLCPFSLDRFSVGFTYSGSHRHSGDMRCRAKTSIGGVPHGDSVVWATLKRFQSGEYQHKSVDRLGRLRGTTTHGHLGTPAATAAWGIVNGLRPAPPLQEHVQ